jgi:Sortase and related acyltransferases
MRNGIRMATVEDTPTIYRFIRELAEFERAPEEVTTSVEELERTVFGEDAVVDALIYEIEGAPVAFALWYYSFSTWQGKPGIYLEDLYVTPAARGKGVGNEILRFLAKHALENGYGRFEWSVLDWNQKAIRVYEASGAKPQSEWLRYRLAGEDLERFARG